MFEKIFQTILKRYCGQFLTGIENLQLTFWSGKIHFHNIALKHQKINQILKQKNIPFSIKYSHIGSLEIDIPWKSLQSTPVEIKIEKVYIVLKMEKVVSVTKNIEQQKMSLIKNYIEHLIKRALQNQKPDEQENQGSYMQKLLVKILHNLNADVSDISIRVISDNGSNEQEMSESGSILSMRPMTEVSQSQMSRRPSSLNSQNTRRKQKGFSFGFCIQSFNIETVDENNKRKFYNLDNKKSLVKKIIVVKQISAYLQEESVCDVFKISQEKKNQFLYQLISRNNFRLLTLDGNVIMSKNIEKKHFFDYFFTMSLQNLEILSTYGQLREFAKIMANFQMASQTKEIKKLSEASEAQQLKMKPLFVQFFPKLQKNNFSVAEIDTKFGEVLCSVSKKNILSWTKQLAVDIVKEQKVVMVMKEKNKKGWLNYIISQAEVKLSEEQIQKIHREVEQIIKSIEYSKRLSIGTQLFLERISIRVCHEQLQEHLSFELKNSKIEFTQDSNNEMKRYILFSVYDCLFQYTNKKEQINSALFKREDQKQNSLIFFQYNQSKNERKIVLSIQKLELNFESRVYLFISQIMKLKSKQEMKSDVKLKKIELQQNTNIHQQLDKMYMIDINIKAIKFKIEVNEFSYICVKVEAVQINTDESMKYHNGKIKNFGVFFNNLNRKSRDKDYNVNDIVSDMTVCFQVSAHFKKIQTKIQALQLNVCQSDLHNIYRNFTKQYQLIKVEKNQQKQKSIIDSSYYKGNLKLLNMMKTWRDYEGVLTDQALYLYDLEPQSELMNEKMQTFTHTIPLNNSKITIISQEQFKIQSDNVNELVECPKEHLHEWVSMIERIVFENSSRAKMYSLIDSEVKSDLKEESKYCTQVSFEFGSICILFCEVKNKNLMKIGMKGVHARLSEDSLKFERLIQVQQIEVQKLERPTDQIFDTFLSISKNSQTFPLKCQIQGLKKLHPKYQGQLEISLTVPFIKVNYDAQFIYRMIKKIAWRHQIPSYTTETRNTKVLEIVKQFLLSSQYERRQQELHESNCKVLEDYDEFIDIGKYRQSKNSCLVLLGISVEISEAEVNLVNGINDIYMFNLKANDLSVQIDKGSQFLFFKLFAKTVDLSDVTGYPNTNKDPNKICEDLPMFFQKEQRLRENALQCFVSKFNIDQFLNKQKLKSFFKLDIYDSHLNFQNQPLNRFIDYLLNQIIGFILAPHSLHKFDGPKRGPFLYENNTYFTEKQIREFVADSLQPFFTKMFINAYDLGLTFNSFPHLEGIDFEIDMLKIETFNSEKPEKIKFYPFELGRFEKQPIYRQLLQIKGFQQKLLKNHYANRMDISVTGFSSPIFKQKIQNFETYIERTLNSEKQILFPFIKLDTSLIIESFTKRLELKAPKSTYNLINKCMMHNLSYDDSFDGYFTSNWQFKNLMKVSELFYGLKVDQFEMIIPEMSTVIVIPDFEFKFLRQTNMVKQMTVVGKILNIFKGSQIIMMPNQSKDKSYEDCNGLQYRIQMKPSGEKVMHANLLYTDILYDLPFFLKFTQYTILDQSCYPPLPASTVISELPDLPLITCKVHLQTSRIKIAIPDSNDGEFICTGQINFTWIRNSLPNPEKYNNNIENFPRDREWCSYRIQLKDINIGKSYLIAVAPQAQVTKSKFGEIGKKRYRLVGNDISIGLKISQLMKLAINGRDRYNDNVLEVKIFKLNLKLSYLDIEQFKGAFASKPEKPDATNNEQEQSEVSITKNQPQAVPPPVQTSYTPHTKISLQISKIELQFGLSELPVPLLNLIIQQAKSTIELIGQNTTLQIKSQISANCWNMLIGRWEPIIEKLSPCGNFKLGKEKYVLFDCPTAILFNISLQSLKILKLISSDFSQKGKFSIEDININKKQANQTSKIKGINISPYVVTNRTGMIIYIYNESAEMKTKLKLKPEERAYLELKNYSIDINQKMQVFFEFENCSEKYEINMDLFTTRELSVIYKQKEYKILLKAISNSIMKEIIISSLFVIENLTSFGLNLYYNCGHDIEENQVYEGKIKVSPGEKTALKFSANIVNVSKLHSQKTLKIEFPELPSQQIHSNCQFPFEALENSYEHQIQLSNNKKFNCILNLSKKDETNICIQPSTYIKNLLPTQIHIQFVVERGNEKIICENKLQVNEEKDLYDFGYKEKLQVRMKMKGFNISQFQSILVDGNVNNGEEYQSELKLIDYRGHYGKISMKIKKIGKVKKIFFYSSAVFINQTNYNLYVFSIGKLIPGQSIQQIEQSKTNYTFINSSQYQVLNFGCGEENPFNSNELRINEYGNHDIFMSSNSSRYDFRVKNHFHCLDTEADIYSYVLKAEPKYVLVNQTTIQLVIRQENVDIDIVVSPGERINWVWPSKDHGKSIQVKIIFNDVENADEWEFSSPINIENEDLQQCVIVLRGLRTNKKLLKVIPIREHMSSFIQFQQVNKIQDHLVTINNQLQFCKLRICQQNTKHTVGDQKYFTVEPRSSIPFGWDYPTQQQKITCEISFVGYLRSKFDQQNVIIPVDKQRTHQITITNEDKEQQKITVKVEIIGLRKKLTFSKREEFEDDDQELEMLQVESKFAFSFAQIGISIITSAKNIITNVKKRAELLFIKLMKSEILVMSRKHARSYQVKIKYINIDNNYNHNTIYPILLTPLKFEKTLKKSRPFFVLLLEQTMGNSDIMEIKQFRVCNEPLSIKIHDEILTAVFEMIDEINKETDTNLGKVDLLAIFRSNANLMQWQQLRLIKPERDIFFREFQIAKLQLQITFSIRPKLTNNNFIIMTILSSFGAAISNVSEAQLTMSRFLKKDKPFSQLKKELTNFYFKQFAKQIYKVLGSINLFGNPYVFFKMLSEGAWEIVNQPTQGFIKGPIQGAIGIVKGGVFFTRNVVAGTCNSFEAISESISRGVSYMTMDQKFIERRQKLKIQKSNHFFTGLWYGAFSVYTGVEVAITGLVRHPVDGYEKDGVIGGLTGTLKGVAGLITKPISGTFQGISKVSEGIKNTALLFQDGPNSKRMRPPRIFFSELSYYKNYNFSESTAIEILQFSSTKYLNEQINHISVIQILESKFIDAYIITDKYFCHVDIISKKIIRDVEISDIKEVKISGMGLEIITNRDVLAIKTEKYKEIYDAFAMYAHHRA